MQIKKVSKCIIIVRLKGSFQRYIHTHHKVKYGSQPIFLYCSRLCIISLSVHFYDITGPQTPDIHLLIAFSIGDCLSSFLEIAHCFLFFITHMPKYKLILMRNIIGLCHWFHVNFLYCC